MNTSSDRRPLSWKFHQSAGKQGVSQVSSQSSDEPLFHTLFQGCFEHLVSCEMRVQSLMDQCFQHTIKRLRSKDPDCL